MTALRVGALARALGFRALAGRLPAPLSDGLLSLYLIGVWITPLSFGMDTVRGVGALFLFEFLALLCGAFTWGIREDPRAWWSVLLAVPFVLAVGSAVQAPVLMILFLWRLAVLAFSARKIPADQIAVLKVRHAGAWALWFLVGLGTLGLPRLGWESLPPDLGWESATAESDFRIFGPWMAVYFTLRTLFESLDAGLGLSGKVAKLAARHLG